MDATFFAGAAVFVASIIASRMLSERNFKKLTEKDRARVMDSFTGMRMWNMVPILLVMLLFLATWTFSPAHTTVASYVVIGIMVAFLVVRHVMVSRKLEGLGVPRPYVRGVLLSSWIYYAGMVVFLIAALLGKSMPWSKGG